jgi:hypothetical protein
MDELRKLLGGGTADVKRRIAFLDCEASSIDEHRSYPIEVGWCFADTEEAESHLIIPHPDWLDWDPQSQELHGLSRQALFEHGKPGPDVARRLLATLGGIDVYADSDLDGTWITKLFAAASVAHPPAIGRFEALLFDIVPPDLGDVSRMALIQESRRIADHMAPRTHRAAADALHLRAWHRAALRLVASEELNLRGRAFDRGGSR